MEIGYHVHTPDLQSMFHAIAQATAEKGVIVSMKFLGEAGNGIIQVAQNFKDNSESE